MQEIEIKVNQVPAEISFNHEEIKAALEEEMQAYRELEVTEDNLPECKKYIATLRKMAKALDGKRKESKEAYMLPYMGFEQKAKELLAIIQQPIDLLDKQVKLYEERQKEEKKQKAQEYFEKATEGTKLRFEDVFRKEWLNVTTSFKVIRADIDVSVSNYRSDIAAIHAVKSEIEEKALEIYHQSGRLADAIQAINDYEEQKKRILEAEERRRKEAEEIAFVDEPEKEAFVDFPGDDEPEEYDSELAFPGAELTETFVYRVTATLEQHHEIMEYLKRHSVECERSE